MLTFQKQKTKYEKNYQTKPNCFNFVIFVYPSNNSPFKGSLGTDSL